jgi:catechol 2,3-dioxygenase-like lactoylglutathione lyase family enzyme
MTALHPKGVNHLALSTTDMKTQLEFWCDVLGCPLKALYWMHGVDGCYHGFVELAPDSYVAFVQHPDNGKEIEIGLSHAGGPGGAVTGGAMQHVAFHVDSLEDVKAMRDRIRSRGIQVMGPIDHGMIQSIYFAGPEGLSLEVCTGSDIDERAWIDPEVTGLCGITSDELDAMKNPAAFESTEEPVPQPPFADAPYHMHPPEQWEKTMAVPDQVMWDNASETTPPVAVD